MRKLGEVFYEKGWRVRQRIRNQTIEEFKETFLSKCRKVKDCLLWTAGNKNHRYGYVWHPIKKKQCRVNRVAYELSGRKIKPGMDVCHTCDNTHCVNPKHLWLGAHTQNMRDMKKKGRMVILRGTLNGNAKLTDKKVSEILSKYVPWKYGTIKLAKEYRVTQGLIMGIVSGKCWKHVPRP